jgi:uncharacterized OB-fold protein
MDQVHLTTRGSLWTWTIQGFEPKYPYVSEGPFIPYGVGYIELQVESGEGSAVLVESRLVEADPDRLRIGAEMELEIFPLFHSDDDTVVMTFAFRMLDE